MHRYLVHNPNFYSTLCHVEASIAVAHYVDVIDTMHCYMYFTSDRPSVRYNGKPLSCYDAVIPCIGASVTFYGTSVDWQFEMMDAFSSNESGDISRRRDKLLSLQLLSRKGIGMPKTGFADHPDKTNDLIENVGDALFVIKLLEGTQAIGVALVYTQKQQKKNFVRTFIEEALLL